jgi:GNAT superfamily N-acetyltransferase
MTDGDAAEVLVLQRCCWVQEAVANDTLDIPALHETTEEVAGWLSRWRAWCVRRQGRLVAAVRARAEGTTWEIGRLMVAPDLAGQGLGRWLLDYAERQAPARMTTYSLFTGVHSHRNLALYQRAGYVVRPDADTPPGITALTKSR